MPEVCSVNHEKDNYAMNFSWDKHYWQLQHLEVLLVWFHRPGIHDIIQGDKPLLLTSAWCLSLLA